MPNAEKQSDYYNVYNPQAETNIHLETKMNA